MTTDDLLLVQLVLTSYLVGLIWFVQVVHYPLYPQVGAETFAAYQDRHVRWTSWVVGPVMLAELALAAWLPFRIDPAGQGLAWAGLVCVVGIWVSTAVFQVPAHHRLVRERDEAAMKRLVRTNWIRTTLWTVRLGLSIMMMAETSGPWSR